MYARHYNKWILLILLLLLLLLTAFSWPMCHRMFWFRKWHMDVFECAIHVPASNGVSRVFMLMFIRIISMSFLPLIRCQHVRRRCRWIRPIWNHEQVSCCNHRCLCFYSLNRSSVLSKWVNVSERVCLCRPIFRVIYFSEYLHSNLGLSPFGFKNKISLRGPVLGPKFCYNDREWREIMKWL